jgi:hypothetical protein
MNKGIPNTCITGTKTEKRMPFGVFYSAIETDLLHASGKAVS